MKCISFSFLFTFVFTSQNILNILPQISIQRPPQNGIYFDPQKATNGNIVVGKNNTVNGIYNLVKGQHNFVLGSINQIQGNSNTNLGSYNGIIGNNNWIVGSGHKIKANGVRMFGPTTNPQYRLP